jgi:Tol biopolymer transport system component
MKFLPLLPLPTLAAAVLLTASGVVAQQTTRISESTTGAQGDRASNRPDLSDDGNLISFESQSTTFVANDTNFVQDVFLRDIVAGNTERVSVGPFGLQANGESKRAVISGDGRYVTFISLANNFDALDFNLTYDIFVRDRQLATTTLVSRALTTLSGNGLSTRPAIASGGGFIAFRSLASDLVAGDLNLIDDIFVYDMATGTLERASISTAGVEGNATSDRPSISGDGSKVVYYSDATNLVTVDTNLQRDIFLHDRATHATSLVSVSSTGVQGNGPSSRPSISADGQYVAFTSDSSNLVANDFNFVGDIFVRDLINGTTELISKSSSGVQGNALSSVPTISADGRYVSYRSIASNLVPTDFNNAEDVFLYDRQTGVTTILSYSSASVPGNSHSSRPSISADGSRTIYQSFSDNLVAGDTNLEEDVFLHEGFGYGTPPNKDVISLSGPSTAATGTQVSLTWSQAPPSAPYWLIYSFNLNGMVVQGHSFDVGLTATVLTTGVCTPQGTGSFLSIPLPASLAGLTVYLELAASDTSGVLYDSNPLALTVF